VGKRIIQRRRPENDALVLKGHHFTGQASFVMRFRGDLKIKTAVD